MPKISRLSGPGDKVEFHRGKWGFFRGPVPHGAHSCESQSRELHIFARNNFGESHIFCPNNRGDLQEAPCWPHINGKRWRMLIYKTFPHLDKTCCKSIAMSSGDTAFSQKSRSTNGLMVVDKLNLHQKARRAVAIYTTICFTITKTSLYKAGNFQRFPLFPRS